MMKQKTRFKFEDIKSVPARELLELSYDELDAFIEEAKDLVDKAEAILYWLDGIKIEKLIREQTDGEADVEDENEF